MNNEVKEVSKRINEDEPIKENYIVLPNEIYDELSITNEEITILTLLYRNYMSWRHDISICSIGLLCDYMKFNTNNNRKIFTTIKTTINSLINKEYIINLYDIYYNQITTEEIVDKNYMFYIEMQEPPVDNFFMIQDIHINKIFESLKTSNISKFSLIRYYIACCRVSNNDQRFGYLTQSKLNSLVTDSRTIQRYNKILQDDLHLIKYCNDYLTPEKHYCTTFIGKWGDDENFDFQLKCEVESKSLIHTTKIKSNIKRSKKQKLNNLEKKNNEDLIRELEQYKALYGKL